MMKYSLGSTLILYPSHVNQMKICKTSIESTIVAPPVIHMIYLLKLVIAINIVELKLS